MSKGNRVKHTFRLPPDLSRQLADYAARKRVSQASIVETAIASFLSPDGSERMEAAFSRRLDRISRQLEKLDFHVEVGNEAVALSEPHRVGIVVEAKVGQNCKNVEIFLKIFDLDCNVDS